MKMSRQNDLLKLTTLAIALFTGASFAGKEELSLVPWPAKVEVKQGTFMLSETTGIVTDAAFTNEAKLLQESLQSVTGIHLPFATSATPAASNVIRLLKTAVQAGSPETYTLEVTPGQVTLRAVEPIGMFRATQTLLQLFAPVDKSCRQALPAVVIEDAPRFEWRGLMLDCSRTFQSIDYLKKTLDRMAFYKLNVLHLHLTDDQGWRIEIKKYPELTAKGACFPAKYNEPAAHQGFYTQEQLRDLVKYAAARHITIVPEIELPGHSLAVLSVMPHLSCTGGPFEIYPNTKGPGITPDIFCAGKEETFEFFSNVLAEVMEIFPSQYIHIGGDEAPKVRWKNCPLCQQRIKDEGLKNEAELQSWFIRRAEKMVIAKGRQMIGWDEIDEGGLPSSAAVMWWRAKNNQNGTEIVKNALKNGHKTVMSPNTYCYFDYPYQRIDTLRAYSFEPIPPELDTAQEKLVLGVQANFWSHIDREPERVDYQLFPRLLAIAERGWSPKDTRDPASFTRRVTAQLENLERLGVRYRPENPAWTPAQMTEEFRPLEWDVTALIRNAGSYEVTFAYKKGAYRLAIRSVELLVDGKVVCTL